MHVTVFYTHTHTHIQVYINLWYNVWNVFSLSYSIRKISLFLSYFRNSFRYVLWTLQWQEGQLVQCPFDAARVNWQRSQFSIIVPCTVTLSADPRIVCIVHREPLCRRSRSPNPLREGKSQHWLSRISSFTFVAVSQAEQRAAPGCGNEIQKNSWKSSCWEPGLLFRIYFLCRTQKNGNHMG